MGYPKAEGLPELRAAIAGWVARRFGVELDPDRELIPTLGSKEAIFSFAQVFADVQRGKDTVLVPDPAYPVYERGAEFAGARIVRLAPAGGERLSPGSEGGGRGHARPYGARLGQLPEQSDRRLRPTLVLRRAGRARRSATTSSCARTRRTASSGSTSRRPRRSSSSDRSRAVVFNTLSKRSSMTGYRSAFVAGPPWVIDALRKYRPSVGTAPQEFVQRASIVAWGDEGHVERARAVYRRKRDVLLPAFEGLGWRAAGKDATMYLWFALPDGETSEAAAERLLEHGIVVAPGAYLGEAGEGYARVALVPTVEDCERAAASSGIRRDGRCARRGDRRRPRPWRAACGREGRRRVDRGRGRQAGDPRLLPRARRRAGGARAVRVHGQDPAQARPRRARRARRAGRRRPLWVVPRRGRDRDAGLREHRRLGRPRDDGGHLGHRRLLRPDRRQRPPRGRRRHRRRAGAGQRPAGDRRGRRVHRLAGHRRRGHDRRRRRGDCPPRLAHGFGADHRRDRRASRSSTAATSLPAPWSSRERGRRTSRPGRTRSAARSSSAVATSRRTAR